MGCTRVWISGPIRAARSSAQPSTPLPNHCPPSLPNFSPPPQAMRPPPLHNLLSSATSQANVGREATVAEEKSDIMNPGDTNRSVSGMDQQAGRNNPVSMELDGRQEGENAPSERQVSPEKLYRAALMRNRFADTILKAREKSLQNEKGDPEKIRREKEELERRLWEDKARLQAEAKAAEEARRSAEAEAAAEDAAEAKRKLDLEREAARQALLQMEKTVEINENSVILKEHEMLQGVPLDHVPNTVDENSPDQSLDGIGGFKLGGLSPAGVLPAAEARAGDSLTHSGHPAWTSRARGRVAARTRACDSPRSWVLRELPTRWPDSPRSARREPTCRC